MCIDKGKISKYNFLNITKKIRWEVKKIKLAANLYRNKGMEVFKER